MRKARKALPDCASTKFPGQGEEALLPVSIIIPTFNRQRSLAHALHALSQLHYPSRNVEVIIVNNGQGECSSSIPPGFPFTVACLDEHKRGRGAARNRGIGQAGGEFILFLDDDIMVSPGLLQAHMEMHRRFQGSMVLGEVLAAPGTSLLDRMHVEESFYGQLDGELLEYGAITCNLSVKKSDLLKAGLFDERFELYGFEDLELGYRLARHAGLSLRYAASAQAWHYRFLEKSEAASNYFQAGHSFIQFIRAHPDTLSPRSSTRISAHLRATLQKARGFRPMSTFESRDFHRDLQKLEESYRDEPHASREQALREAYRFLMDYSFHEGVFMAARRLHGGEPLLAVPEPGSRRHHTRFAIFWNGLFSQYTGFGSYSRLYTGALRDLGHDVVCYDRENPRLQALDRPLSSFHFYMHNFWKPAESVPPGPFKIHLSACETTQVPAEWVEPYNRMDEIWVPSTFCRDALLNSGITSRVTVIPLFVDTASFIPTPGARKYSVHGYFCFMSIGELWSYKGLDVVMEAYLREFEATDDVVLMLKIGVPRPLPPLARIAEIGELVKSIKARIRKKKLPRFVIFHNPVPEKDFPDFMNSCDAYVGASRGEGFCLPLLEAMSLEKVVIATAFGGAMDFLKSDNCYMLDYTLAEARAPDGHPEHQQGMWAEPSVEHLVKLMRHVYEQREEGRQKARRARRMVREHWNRPAVRALLAERLNEIYYEC